MTSRSTSSYLLKLIAFWLLFVLLHFSYDWLPYPVIAVFAGNSEAVVQHMKMAFFAYTFVSLGEFFLRRPPVQDRLRFFDSRLLATLIVSFAGFLWYLVPAGRGVGMPNDLLEILYANIVLLLVGFGTVTLERDFSQREFSKVSRVVLVAFYLTLLAILVIGTFRTPWGGFWVT